MIRFKRKVLVRVCLGAVALAGVLFVAALWFSPWLLTFNDAPTSADAIVVLGGDWVLRPKRAAELYHEGWARRIIVSGKGEAKYLRDALVERGVPADAVVLEDEAMNTQQNAEYSIRLLRQEKASRVIIVTSWFHSRRALHSFRHYAPEMKFISVPTMTDCPKPGWLDPSHRRWVRHEYEKLAWYWVRYGISPF